MKKLVSLLIIACIVTVMASCGGAGANVDNTVVEPVVEPTYKDMGGKTFLFNTNWPQEYFPDEAFSAAGDKMRARYKEMEGLYNCTFDIVLFNDTQASSDITKAVATGTNIPDLIDVGASNAYAAYKAGLLYALDDI